MGVNICGISSGKKQRGGRGQGRRVVERGGTKMTGMASINGGQGGGVAAAPCPHLPGRAMSQLNVSVEKSKGSLVDKTGRDGHVSSSFLIAVGSSLKRRSTTWGSFRPLILLATALIMTGLLHSNSKRRQVRVSM